MTPGKQGLSRSYVPDKPLHQPTKHGLGSRHLWAVVCAQPVERIALYDDRSTLNPSQRQRLLVTCKHIDKLLGEIEETLNATASKSLFPRYVNDITGQQRKAIEDHIKGFRAKILSVMEGQSLALEEPTISAAHSIHVGLTFMDIAIAELAPGYMRGYGPVSEEAAADLREVIAELQSGVRDLCLYVPPPGLGIGEKD